MFNIRLTDDHVKQFSNLIIATSFLFPFNEFMFRIIDRTLYKMLKTNSTFIKWNEKAFECKETGAETFILTNKRVFIVRT